MFVSRIFQVGWNLAAQEKIETTWPSGAFPRRLACAPDGANVMLAAASKFGLFQAELQQRRALGMQMFRLQTFLAWKEPLESLALWALCSPICFCRKSASNRTAFLSAAFNYAPACDALEGEATPSHPCNKHTNSCIAKTRLLLESTYEILWNVEHIRKLMCLCQHECERRWPTHFLKSRRCKTSQFLAGAHVRWCCIAKGNASPAVDSRQNRLCKQHRTQNPHVTWRELNRP